VAEPAPTAATRVAAVIGDPVRHSLSPAIFNAAFRASDLDWVFVAFEVVEAQLRAALDGVRALGITGISVTMPHKGAVAAHLHRLTPAAEQLGAVNTVRNVAGDLEGGNTDGEGFLRALHAETGFDPSGRSCAVVGAGGAGRAVMAALAGAGAARVVVVNRDPGRAEQACLVAGAVGEIGPMGAVEQADLVVNATPVGMTGSDPSRSPIPDECLREGQVVADLVYRPDETALLAAARRRGITAVNGLGMLVHQAGLQFEWWTGREAPLEVMFDAVRAELRRS
jgi:shikimate dehydrogenase